MNRRNCLANYLRDYPGSVNGVAEVTYGERIEDFLVNTEIFDQVPQGGTERIRRISQDPSARTQSFRTLAEVDRTSNSGAFNGVAGQKRSPASAPVTPPGQSANPQQQQQTQFQTGTFFNPGSLPEAQNATVSAAPDNRPARPQTTEEAQTKVSDLSAELESLRAQIAEKRNNPQNPELASLRTRYSMLEEQLRKAEADLAERTRIDGEERSRRAVNNDDEDSSPKRVRRSARPASGSAIASASPSAVSAAPVASQAGSPNLAPVSSAASAVQSGVSSSARGRTSSSTSPGQNREADSGNGNADSAAITVASATVAEYEQIRAEAAVNQISEQASAEILSQIENGDTSFLEQYRSRINAFPGKYVLLDLGEMEFVVSKNGEQLSLMSKDGRFIASESRPVPVREKTESEREHTLRALQNRLTE